MRIKDERIVVQIQRGDREKYGEIIDRYQKKLGSYIKRLINQDEATVEDLVEEVLIKGYENINEFEVKRKFSSWIYRIAHNQAVDYIKKKKLRLTPIEDKEEWLTTGQKLIEEIEIEKENQEKVWEAVEKLEVKYRELIILYYHEGKITDEISEILKTSPGNVRTGLSRAREKLKEILRVTKRI